MPSSYNVQFCKLVVPDWFKASFWHSFFRYYLYIIKPPTLEHWTVCIVASKTCETEISDFTGVCYWHETTRASWSIAWQNCANSGGRLAMVQDPEVHNFILKWVVQLLYLVTIFKLLLNVNPKNNIFSWMHHHSCQAAWDPVFVLWCFKRTTTIFQCCHWN